MADPVFVGYSDRRIDTIDHAKNVGPEERKSGERKSQERKSQERKSQERESQERESGSRARATFSGRPHSRQLTLTSALMCLCLVLGQASVVAAESLPFRIGTGGSGGAYFPIGSLIAEAISDGAGHQTDSKYRVKDLYVIAQRSNGSASNVGDIGAGLLEAGLAQSNTVYWSYNGTGPYEGSPPIKSLRTVGTLYFESLHLVIRNHSGIKSLGDLAGHVVSVDEIGSGTQLDVTAILSELGLDGKDLKIVYLKAEDAIVRMRRNELDAFFIVAGYPVAGIGDLIEDGVARLLPIVGPVADKLMRSYPYFSIDKIPVNTYSISPEVTTLALPAQLIVSEFLDEELVYKITGMLWSETTGALLAEGHPKGRELKLQAATIGISAPVHDGAARYYRENNIAHVDAKR